MSDPLLCTGQLRLNDGSNRRTSGQFTKLVTDNAASLCHYLGQDIYPGSLNVEIGEPLGLQYRLDARMIRPAGTIPRSRLINMPPYLGEAAFWRADLLYRDACLPTWVFRRIGSKIRPGVIELLSPIRLRDIHQMQDRDRVTLRIYSGP